MSSRLYSLSLSLSLSLAQDTPPGSDKGSSSHAPEATGLGKFWQELKRRIFLNRKLDLWFIFDRLRGNPRFDALLEN